MCCELAVDISNTAISLEVKLHLLIDNGVYRVSQLFLRLLMEH